MTQFGTTLANSIEQSYGNVGGSVCTSGWCTAIFTIIMLLNALVVAFFSLKLLWMWEKAIARKVMQLLQSSRDVAVQNTAHYSAQPSAPQHGNSPYPGALHMYLSTRYVPYTHTCPHHAM